MPSWPQLFPRIGTQLPISPTQVTRVTSCRSDGMSLTASTKRYPSFPLTQGSYCAPARALVAGWQKLRTKTAREVHLVHVFLK